MMSLCPRVAVRKIPIAAIGLVVVTTVSCSDEDKLLTPPALEVIGDPGFNPDHYGIAEAYAPIIYQYSRSTADLISLFTYDDDWDGGNNWDNMNLYPLKGYVYWGLTETDRHYFIYYSVYHPRDWCHMNVPIWGTVRCDNDQHENDLEAILIVVDKYDTGPGFPNGRVVMMETRYHLDIITYANTAAKCDNDELRATTDFSVRAGTVARLSSACMGWVQDDEGWYRPSVFVESQGHGILSTTDPRLPPGIPQPSIRYTPFGMTGFVPSGGEGAYGLRWIDQWGMVGGQWLPGMWSHRFSSLTFENVGGGEGIFPYGIDYGSAFRQWGVGRNNGLFGGARPLAPWAQHDGIMTRPLSPPEANVFLGDWHNQGAFTMASRYSSQSWDLIYDWSDKFDVSYYTSNIFLDETEPPTSPVYFSSSHLVDSVVPGDSVPVPPLLNPDRSWERESLSEWTPVAAANVVPRAALLAVRDTAWGDPSGTLTVLRVVGSSPTLRVGPVSVEPRSDLAFFIRYRSDNQNLIPTFTWTTGEGDTSAPAAAFRIRRYEAGSWRIGSVILTSNPDWRNDNVTRYLLVAFEGRRSGTDTVDIALLRLGY
jgi:hypothetical protein